MMKCAVGCVNKMAFLTGEDNPLEFNSHCIPSGVTWLTLRLLSLLTFFFFYYLMAVRQRTTELAVVLTYQEETGISACLYSSQYVGKSKRRKKAH